MDNPKILADIVLIQVPFRGKPVLEIPFACLSLASYIAKHNHSSQIFDFNFFEQKYKIKLAESLPEIPYAKTNCYGISFYSDQLADVVSVAQFLKKRDPSCVVIIGGPGGFGQEEEILTLNINTIDFLCSGEGEVVFNPSPQLSEKNGDKNEQFKNTALYFKAIELLSTFTGRFTFL